MASKNDKIGAWGLFGTIIGFSLIGIFIGILTDILDKGFKVFLFDTSFFLLDIILFVATLCIILYIIQLFPEKWIPFLQAAALLSLLYYMQRSLGFTIFTGLIMVAYFLVNKRIENKRLSKVLNIILAIVFLFTLSEVA